MFIEATTSSSADNSNLNDLQVTSEGEDFNTTSNKEILP